MPSVVSMLNTCLHSEASRYGELMVGLGVRLENVMDIAQCRVHDLRHTFGRRLRAADVSFENRQELLGHKSSRIADHYCATEVTVLRESVERLSRVNLA